MTQFPTVTIQGKALLCSKRTLTLTDKWLIVKNQRGNEEMRLSPSQANIRVVNRGYGPIINAITFFLSGVLLVWCAFIDDASAFLAPFGGVLIGLAINFCARCKWSKLYLTGDILQFYFVKPAELPKLYQIMEAVENWTASKGR